MDTMGKASAAIAFVAAGVAAVPAGAQPRLEQTGDGYGAAYGGAAAERGNVAGGRAARLAGGGDNATLLHAGPDPALGGRFAALSGGVENAALTCAEPAPAAVIAEGAAGTGGRRG